MKKQAFKFAAIVIAVVVFVVVANKKEHEGFSLAGGPVGKSLKELNDSAKIKKGDKTNVVTFVQANSTTAENLFQVMTIANWEKTYNNWYVGADAIGTISTQFGVMCPTYDVRFGFYLASWRAECKIGDFTRNSVTTANGFDPQYANFCILSGHSASVSNAVQLSLIANGTLVYVGHQGGSEFYKFNGNYYVGAEQKIGHFTLSGGVDFAKDWTEYAAIRWANRQNEVTLNGNNLGGDAQNFILSYVHRGISLCKGINMHVGNSLWFQQKKQGLQLVSGFNKGKTTLFAQAGGYVFQKTFTPVFGVGLNYNL